MVRIRLLVLMLMIAVAVPPVGSAGAGPEGRPWETLNREGVAAYQAGDQARALTLWQQGLELARQAGDQAAMAKLLHNLGALKTDQKRIEEALALYQEALTLVRQSRDREGEFMTLFNLGRLMDQSQRFPEALDYYKQALTVARELKNKEGEARALTNLGTVCDTLGKGDKALTCYQEALKIYQEMGNTLGEQKIHSNLGLILTSHGKYAEAREAFEKALKIARERRDAWGQASVLLNLGEVLEHLRRYDEARTGYEQALATARQLRDLDLTGRILINLGNQDLNEGRFQEALARFQEALRLKKELGDRLGEALALLNLGQAYDAQGRAEAAGQAYQTMLTIYRELKTPGLLANALMHLGNVAGNQGRYEQALAYYTQALAQLRELKNRREEAKLLINLGSMHYFLNLNDLAVKLHQEALALGRELDDRSVQARALLSLGAALRNLGRYAEAQTAFEQSLELSRAVSDRQAEEQALLNLAALFHLLERRREALALYRQALALAGEKKQPGGQAVILIDLTLLYRELEQYDQALITGREALAQARQKGDPRVLAGALQVLASVEGLTGRHADAIRHYEEALAFVETLRAGIAEKESRAAFMTGKFFVYDQFIDLLVHLHQQDPKKGYDRKALEIFERKQGRLFLEEVGKSGARSFAGLPPELRQRELELEAQAEKLNALLAAAHTETGGQPEVQTPSAVGERLHQLQVARERLEQELKTRHPDYYALRHPRPATLKEIQEQVLADGETLLIYGVMARSTALWVVGRKDFALFRLEVSEKELREKVKAFRQGLEAVLAAIEAGKSESAVRRTAQESLTGLQQQGRELYHLLAPPGARPLLARTKTLYVAPTGPLHFLPFEALTLPPDAAGGGSRYLVEEFPVAYLSSASLLKILRDAAGRRKTRAPHPLLAFAHPVYRTETDPPEEAGSLRGLRTRAYRDLLGGSIPELPETAEEVRAIKSALKAPDRTQPLQLREAASRSRVLEFQQEGRLIRYRYLVFSCHGVVPPETDPVLQPALVLSHPDPATGGEGFLTLADVFGLSLRADLVVLSACNTGRGRELAGEGVVGLTRAFMFAGSQAAAVTLWAVESASAKAMSTGLFHFLRQGRSRAAALQAAKLQLLRNPEDPLYQHPFFWAPLVVFGEGR